MKHKTAIIAAAVLVLGKAYQVKRAEWQAQVKKKDKALIDSALKTTEEKHATGLYRLLYGKDPECAVECNWRDHKRGTVVALRGNNEFRVLLDVKDTTPDPEMSHDLVLGVKIGFDHNWEQQLKQALHAEFHEQEVINLMAGKDFKPNLEALFLRIGIKADAVKLLTAPAKPETK